MGDFLLNGGEFFPVIGSKKQENKEAITYFTNEKQFKFL